jgi:hypothetical protein
MPMQRKYLVPSLLKFLEGNPDLFMRCDESGRENPNGEFWNVREPISRGEIIRTQKPEPQPDPSR